MQINHVKERTELTSGKSTCSDSFQCCCHGRREGGFSITTSEDKIKSESFEMVGME